MQWTPIPHLEADDVDVVRLPRLGRMVLPDLLLIQSSFANILLVQTGEDDLQVKSQSLRQPTEHPVRERVLVDATGNRRGQVPQSLSMEHVVNDGSNLRLLEVLGSQRRGSYVQANEYTYHSLQRRTRSDPGWLFPHRETTAEGTPDPWSRERHRPVGQ